MAGPTHSGHRPGDWKNQPEEPLVARDPGIRPPEPDRTSWFFPTEDDLPESFRHLLISKLFMSCLAVLLKQLGRDDIVGANQLFAWLKDKPNVRVAPDAYLSSKGSVPMDGVIETWKPGQKPPLLALEVVSEDRKKDYEHAPAQYAELGVQELIVFDPAAWHTRSRKRKLLTVYRRQADGSFAQVAAGRRPVYSPVMGLWLVPQTANGLTCLRLSRDESGLDLIPSEEEAAEVAERRAKEEERRAKEEERRAKEEAVARAEAAEAMNRKLIAELRALKRGTASD
jgi:Uma2 family endonuclease